MHGQTMGGSCGGEKAWGLPFGPGASRWGQGPLLHGWEARSPAVPHRNLQENRAISLGQPRPRAT